MSNDDNHNAPPLARDKTQPPRASHKQRSGAPRVWHKARPKAEKKAPEPTPEPQGLGARRLAVALIEAVVVKKRSLEDALESVNSDPSIANLEPRDRGFGRLIAATVLRRWGSLNEVLGAFLAKPLEETASRAKIILLSGAAQILLIGTPAHAAINLAVEQASRDSKAHRFAKLTNAVLRRVTSDGPAILDGIDAARADVPPWMLDRWIAAYGETEALAIARASLVEAPLDLSLRDPATAQNWAQQLGGTVLATGSVRLGEHGRIEDLAGYTEGAWWVQDAAAALPARLVGDVRDRNVADLAAAPGGKTAALAAAGARVTAVDASAERLQRLTANMERLALSDRVSVVAARVGQWHPKQAYDAVLLDAPCTASGTIRRHPDILHVKRPEDAGRLAVVQQRMIGEAAKHVKPGGTLVYCVCSLDAEEGPDVVAHFLAANPAFSRHPIAPADLGCGQEAATWITRDGDLRTLPCHDPRLVASSDASRETATGDVQVAPGLDGFYAARLVREAGASS